MRTKLQKVNYFSFFSFYQHTGAGKGLTGTDALFWSWWSYAGAVELLVLELALELVPLCWRWCWKFLVNVSWTLPSLSTVFTNSKPGISFLIVGLFVIFVITWNWFTIHQHMKLLRGHGSKKLLAIS